MEIGKGLPMAKQDKIQEAVDQNYETFRKLLPELLKTHEGKFALMRHGEIVEFFGSMNDAIRHGQCTFDDGLYSVQEVTDVAVDLGWFSYVVD